MLPTPSAAARPAPPPAPSPPPPGSSWRKAALESRTLLPAVTPRSALSQPARPGGHLLVLLSGAGSREDEGEGVCLRSAGEGPAGHLPPPSEWTPGLNSRKPASFLKPASGMSRRGRGVFRPHNTRILRGDPPAGHSPAPGKQRRACSASRDAWREETADWRCWRRSPSDSGLHRLQLQNNHPTSLVYGDRDNIH